MGDEEDQLQRDRGSPNGRKVGLRDRIKHFTWANFTCTQSTGGIAILLSQLPHQFSGQQTAGTVIFVFNLVVFVILCAAMITRFALHPQTMKRSVINTPESFFMGSFWVSCATIVICMQRFAVPHAGPWVVVAVRVLFWMYAAMTLLYTCVMFVVSFSQMPVQPDTLSPGVFLKVYNTMLSGTVASAISQSQPPNHRLPIIVAGIAYQGLGLLGSIVLLAWFIGGLFRYGLGAPNQRPGLFMPVGAPGYSILTFMGCAMNLPVEHSYFTRYPNAVEILQVLALWVSIFLWLFGFWLFAMALVANLPNVFPKVGGGRGIKPRMAFTLSWWALVFPNIGFVIGTGFIGQVLESDVIQWVATAMGILLFVVWLMDLVLHVKAMVAGQVMWPGKDEDASK
ncbi:hypothetical protein S7711_03675 [Stachybotrys chartarum IBT 7711]|uniref:Uncharacterized protein n=1 Tax=Stachybotrys chartarum (strain CBS 109288 / IBT 7711) TaxID=1280523 RepID=A0A084B7H9_STACB|nr:hypothetical protein S7711_03675 [Stachybotrys chartarum IBT 7711]